jgi:hypothetical protein
VNPTVLNPIKRGATFCFGLAKGPSLTVPFRHVRKPRGDAAMFLDALIASVAQLAEQLTLKFGKRFSSVFTSRLASSKHRQ